MKKPTELKTRIHWDQPGGAYDGAALILGYQIASRLVEKGILTQAEAAECFSWTANAVREATEGEKSELEGESAARACEALGAMMLGYSGKTGA